MGEDLQGECPSLATITTVLHQAVADGNLSEEVLNIAASKAEELRNGFQVLLARLGASAEDRGPYEVRGLGGNIATLLRALSTRLDGKLIYGADVLTGLGRSISYGGTRNFTLEQARGSTWSTNLQIITGSPPSPWFLEFILAHIHLLEQKRRLGAAWTGANSNFRGGVVLFLAEMDNTGTVTVTLQSRGSEEAIDTDIFFVLRACR